MAYRYYLYQTSEPNEHDRISATIIDSTYEEEPAEYIAKFPVTTAELELIKGEKEGLNADVKVIDGELVIDEISSVDIMLNPDSTAQAEAERQALEYAAWLETDEGRVASRYLYFMQHGEWPREYTI